MLVDEKRVNDLLKQKSGVRAFIRGACKLTMFFVFVVIFTMLTLSAPLEVHRSFEAHLRRRFDTEAAMHLSDVASIESLWEFTNQTFLPALYGQNTRRFSFPNHVLDKLLPLESNTRLLGVVRMRMVKVDPGHDCALAQPYSAFFDCYGPYMEEMESTEDFGPTAMEGGRLFRYFADPTSRYFDGKYATYAPGGFMEVLTSNYTRTVEKIHQMTAEHWLDRSTRAVWLEFTLMNFNFGIYAVCRISFEISPTNSYVNTFDIDILQQRHLSPLGSGTDEEWAYLVMEVLLIIFAVGYICEELSEICECSCSRQKPYPRMKWDYWTDGWNILDWLQLSLIFIGLGFRVSGWMAAGGLALEGLRDDNPADADVDAFRNLHNLALAVRTMRSIYAFNTVLLYLKAIKYIDIVPSIAMFFWTVRLSWQMLLSFCSVFFSAFVGFVLAFHVAFGEQMSIFQTPWKALVFLARSFLGDAEVSGIYASSPLLGSVLLLAYIVGFFFVLMNIFQAIMISALSDAKRDQDAKQNQSWKKTLDQWEQAGEAVEQRLKLGLRFRLCFKGASSRLIKRRARLEKLENDRIENYQERMMLRNVQDDMAALGPMSPQLGRRPRKGARSLAAVDPEEDEPSDVESEEDLGPLWNPDQLSRKELPAPSGEAAVGMGDEPAPPPSSALTESAVVEIAKSAIYIQQGIIQRTSGARRLVTREMAESQEVLNGIGSVLRVLAARARDLETQQDQFLNELREQSQKTT